MFPKFVVCLLIFTVQACPLRCTAMMVWTHTAAESPATPIPSCCPKCRLAYEKKCQSQTKRGMPARPAQGPVENGCQCVCTGAVLEKAHPFRVSVERDINDLVAVTLHVGSNPSQTDSFENSPAQLRRTTPGRLVCCLNMSFLC